MVEGLVLEPGFAFNLIRLDEFFVRLGQVDDAFDQTDDAARTAGHQRDDDAQHATTRVVKDESVDAKSTEHDAKHAGKDALAVGGLR